jgi:hypothetical protein
MQAFHVLIPARLAYTWYLALVRHSVRNAKTRIGVKDESDTMCRVVKTGL